MLRTAILVSCFALFGAGAQANPWPQRPVTLIVPYPAGGGVDTAARIYSAAISRILGRQVVVENRAGASGAIGAQAVVRAAPDGYTFLLSSPAEVLVTPIAGKPLPYDPEKDLTPIAFVGDTPLGIVAHPERGPKSLGELVASSQKQGVKFNYGTPGSGSTMHFAGAAMQAIAGVESATRAVQGRRASGQRRSRRPDRLRHYGLAPAGSAHQDRQTDPAGGYIRESFAAVR